MQPIALYIHHLYIHILYIHIVNPLLLEAAHINITEIEIQNYYGRYVHGNVHIFIIIF